MTLISPGGTSRRLLFVQSVTLKHGLTQASPASARNQRIRHTDFLAFQLICNFNASLDCATPDITAPCVPLTLTARQEMQALALFANDSQLYEGILHRSNAQVQQSSAPSHF